ncbi:hypothetical protein BJX99DRAFT_255703 [Aspergillus californicus]
MLYIPILLLVLVGAPTVEASGWDGFSNNLVTDLAPFLSLFGEQVTKQYLSESTTFLDPFIFAMAPLGILTAVVSAIRVCGSPSLRAFIGRAQEGAGQAEAELYSSTSRDVGEIYNKGGIARSRANIFTFQKYMEADTQSCWNRRWRYLWTGKRNKAEVELASLYERAKTPLSPNLSLNIGIKKRLVWVYWAAALGGFFLQAGVVAFAIVATY